MNARKCQGNNIHTKMKGRVCSLIPNHNTDVSSLSDYESVPEYEQQKRKMQRQEDEFEETTKTRRAVKKG
jgi:hypothetical protein